MNTEVAVPGTKDKINDLINEMVPKAHQESAKLLMEENAKKDTYIKVLEGKIKDASEAHNKIYNELEEAKKKISDDEQKNKEVLKKEADLKERTTQITVREVNMDHHDEIAKMKVESAQSEKSVITDVLHTIFKPPALRETIHRQIPVTEGGYTPVTSYDANGNQMQTYQKSHEMTHQESATDTKTTDQE